MGIPSPYSPLVDGFSIMLMTPKAQCMTRLIHRIQEVAVPMFSRGGEGRGLAEPSLYSKQKQAVGLSHVKCSFLKNTNRSSFLQ